MVMYLQFFFGKDDAYVSKISPTGPPGRYQKDVSTNCFLNMKEFFLFGGERGSLGYLARVCGQNH